jgi:hypothetical protein
MLFCASCKSENNALHTSLCLMCGAEFIAHISSVRCATDDECYQPYGGGSDNSGGGSGEKEDDQGSYRPNVPPVDPRVNWQGTTNPYDAAASYGGGGVGAPLQPWSAGSGLFAVGEKRDPVMVLVFTLLTCGIYGWYWWFVTATDVKNALQREDINPTMELVLGFVTCGIYLIFMYYKYPQLLLEMQNRVRLPSNDLSTVSLLLGIFFPLAAMLILQTELNKIWDAARGGGGQT